MKLALISAYNKQDLDILVLGLLQHNYTVLSTGGTSKHLQRIGVDVINVESFTGFEEILSGRVKTLHPRIYAGILARRNKNEDLLDLQRIKGSFIDIVAVSLYPFEQVISEKKHRLEDAIENIDIGGPALLRAAAKNYKDVLVLCEPADYATALTQLYFLSSASSASREKALLDFESFKQAQAVKAFSVTAQYDASIAAYLELQNERSMPHRKTRAQRKSPALPQHLQLSYTKVMPLRYGENPHQKAALYKPLITQKTNQLLNAKQLHGKELSFNNLRDAEAAIAIAQTFKEAAAVGVKHGNPCAVAQAKNTEQAWAQVYKADPVSIFGGVVAFNKKVDTATATLLSKLFLELIIAPKFSASSLTLLRKKKNLRLLQIPFSLQKADYFEYRSLENALLVQERDARELSEQELSCVTRKKPTAAQLQSLLFAWKVVKYVKSNAIVVAKNTCTSGIGAGQPNRVGAAEIALEQAGKLKKSRGAVLASDAFFPMRDSVDLAKRYGISAVIQPGGSVRDQETIAACNEHRIAMLFTNIRHFLH